MSTRSSELFIPAPATQEESGLARTGSRLLAACIGRGATARIRVIDNDGEIEVPVSALRLLVDILDNMAAGNAVSLVPVHAELTTQQTADFLNVSRPYVVKLLESGKLPYHKVGTHRRVFFKDLADYRKQQVADSREGLAQLAQEAQDMGFYE